MTETTLRKPSKLSLKQFPKRNGWYWVPVEFILQNTHYSVDYGYLGERMTWEFMMQRKCSDTGFMYLVRSIQEHGWKSAIGWDEGEITEGHHRLFAAILLCEPEVPCTPYGTNYGKYGDAHHVSGHGEPKNAEPDGLNL